MAEINMEDIKPNSHTYKQEKRKNLVEKDALARSGKKKENGLMNKFFSEDFYFIKEWLLFDLLIPGIKNTILDMLSMMFFGETSERSKTNRKNPIRRDYRSEFDKGRSSRRRREEYDEDDDKIEYDNIILKRRSDAEDIIREMRKLIRDDGACTIADLLDMVGEDSKFTDNDWGWDDKEDFGIRQVRNGFLIDVCKPRRV